MNVKDSDSRHERMVQMELRVLQSKKVKNYTGSG